MVSNIRHSVPLGQSLVEHDSRERERERERGLQLSIWKYGSTFNVGMGHVQNGRLYLRYGSSSLKTATKWDKKLIDKKPFLFCCRRCPKSPPIKAEKNKYEIFDFVHLLSSNSSYFFFFFHSFTNNSITTWSTRTFYTPSESFPTLDVPFVPLPLSNPHPSCSYSWDHEVNHNLLSLSIA